MSPQINANKRKYFFVELKNSKSKELTQSREDAKKAKCRVKIKAIRNQSVFKSSCYYTGAFLPGFLFFASLRLRVRSFLTHLGIFQQAAKGRCVSLIRPTTLNFKLCTAFHSRSFAFICIFFFFPPVFADQPNIRDLDRMFTTRAERAQLDALRARMRGMEGVAVPAAENRISTSPQNVEMQGIMQRQKGKPVTWINGQNTLNSNAINDNIRVTGQPKALSGANVAIDGQNIRLKPGQVWQPETGEVVESYKTKVVMPATKGADEPAQNVQTEADAGKEKSVAPKTEIKLPDAVTPPTNKP